MLEEHIKENKNSVLPFIAKWWFQKRESLTIYLYPLHEISPGFVKQVKDLFLSSLLLHYCDYRPLYSPR